MKLRLPHKLQTALLTAFASVTFTTVGTATLPAADDVTAQVASVTDTGFVVSEEALEVNLGDEDEEASEPDSAPANHAGYNGVHGSSDDADRASSVSEGGEDTAPAAATVSGQEASVSEVTVSDDLGFTTQVTDGTASSNYTPVITETATQAAQTVQTVGTTTQETTSTTQTTTSKKNSLLGVGTYSLASGLGSPVGISGGSTSGSPALATPFTVNAAGVTAGQQTEVVLTTTFQVEKTTAGDWTFVPAAGTTLTIQKNIVGEVDKTLVKRVGGDALGNKSNSEGQLRPDINVCDNANGGWILTFNVTNTDSSAVIIENLVADAFLFSSSNAYQNRDTNRKFTITTDFGGASATLEDITLNNYTYSAKTSDCHLPLTFNFGEGISLQQNESATLTLTVQRGSTETSGCFLGLNSLTFNGSVQRLSYTWAAETDGSDWTESVWKKGEQTGQEFASGSDAVFDSTATATQVNISSEVSARNVTVNEKDYTFKLSGDSASLRANAIQIASGRTLAVSGGAVTTGGLSLGSESGVDVDDGSSLTITGALSNAGLIQVGDGSSLDISASNYSSVGNMEVHGTLKGLRGANLETGNSAITGDGTVQVTGELQYHDANKHKYLEEFTGTVEFIDGSVLQSGNGNWKKFANATLKVSSGGTLKGWATTFNHDILLNGGTLSHANNWINYNGNISLLADSFVAGYNDNNKTTLQGTINGNYKLTSTGGKVQIDSSGMIGALETEASETIINGTGLTVGSLTGTKALTINQGEQLTVYTVAGGAYSGSIGGAGTLVKRGSGTLTLDAANNTCQTLNVYEGVVELAKWTGSTNVYDGGTLRIISAGANQTGSVTVNPGGTLDVATNGTVTSENAYTVNGSTITGTGTLDIETLNVGGNGAIVSGNVSLGSENAPMAHLHLENTLISKGDNAVYAAEVTFVGDLGESVGAGSTFKDTVSGATANGYVESAKVVIVENAAGSLTSNLGDGNHTIIHEGWTYTLQQDEKSNIYISLTASTERAMQGDYYINTGDVTYGDSGNATGLERTNTLFVNGGNLTFTDTDLKTGVALHVHKDGVVTLGEGRNLNEGAVHVKAGSTMTLDGSGTYVLETATLDSKGLLPLGTVLKGGADGFTGTVLVSKDSVLNGTDLSGLVNGTDSRVGFNGATGSLKTGIIAQNIYLQDYGSQVALSLNTGTSGETRTFTGAITGTGTLARSYVTGSGDIGGVQNYEFSSDLSGWAGVFNNQVEGEANTTNLTFSGGATEVNAEIKNGVAGSTGLLNVSTTGSEAKQFNKGVTATSFSASGGDVTFNGALRLTGNASAEVAKLIINNTAMVGGNLSGNVEVTKTGNLTVGGTAALGNLYINGIASFNGTVSASGAVTVNEGASLYLNNGGISLGDAATLTINSGSMVGLSGWTETKGTPTESGVVMTGFTGGQLFSGNGANVTVETDSYFMKDGAKFLYSGAEATDNRVTVHTDGDNAGTVDIIEAIYYNVHTGDSKTMDEVKEAVEEEHVTLDYIHIQSGGTLTGVTDENKGSFGISSVQGSGTMAVGEGTLTDSAAFVNFTGTIRVDAGGTFETDGTITRAITMAGGTLHATDNIDLSRNVTYTAGTTSTLDISDGKAVTMTQAVTANLDKRGGGTLHITDTTSGGTRSPMLTGDLHVYDGTAVISSKRHNSDNCGVVNGSITVEQGADLIMEGFDALGHSNNCSEYTKKITLNAGTADNLTTLAFTRNGSDPTTLQHTTLSTDIEMNGNTEMSGLRLNAFGTHNENNLGAGAYIHVSGMNNTISNTFAMRYNAYFQVDDNSELTLTGNMELFDQGAKDKKVIKTGAGVLDFAGANSSLYAIDIQAGLVEVTGNLTFNGTDSTQFLMAEGARFAVQNGATFNYRGWLFENNDGTHAAGTVTAAERSTTNILEDSNLVVGGMKLTNNNTGDQAISARLDGVQLMHTGGKVTINNAPTGTTQHIATLTVKTGETTLKSATLDAASVYPDGTLTFSAGETVELGSTILNGGTVNLAGTINVNDLSAFAPQKGAGFIDKKKHSGASDTYNGFYQGSSYYLIQQEAADSEVTGSKSLTLTYKGSDSAVTAFAKEEDTNSYYFSVTEPSTLYYLNGEDGADTTYSTSSTGNNMYDGPGDDLHTTGIVMNAAGARLTLATNLRDYVRTITGGSSGIEAKQNGTIDIQSGVTLHQSDLSGDSGVLVSLVGAGTFDLVGTTLKSVSSGLTDGSAWQGTVRASGTADNMNATMMGNVNSTLLLDGVQGTLTNADTRYVMKIELRNGGEGAVTDKALDNTFSTGANRVFSNTVSGSGDILMTGEASGSTQSIAFTGDVSNWTGDFTTATQGTTNLAFNNKAAVINADVMEGAGSTINLSAGPAVDAGGQSAVQVFNGNITASRLTVEAGADTTLDNTTAISGVIDATAENAQLHVQGTTTAQTVRVGNGHVGINNNAGTGTMATVTGGSGTAVMDGGLELSSGENLATIKGATQGQLSTVAGANVKVMSEAASLKLENLVLSDDTFVRGTSGNGNLIISGRVEQQMSTNNTRAKADTTVTSALTMTGTTGTTMEYDNNKVHNLDFTSMCQLAQISGSAGTLVFDFTGMDGYDDWEHNFSEYGFIGVKFDPAVAMAFKAANQQNEAIYADNLQVVARTTDADGQVVERIGYYNNGGNGAVVGSIVYFQVPEPTTGTLSLLALAALAARRRKH